MAPLPVTPAARQKLSVVVISFNRAPIIETCLRALWFADELLVVDKSSTDGSDAIAAGIADRVITVEWSPAVEDTRVFAVAQCTNEWILCLDDDECLSLAAGHYILAELADPRAEIYALPLRHYILGIHDEAAYYWPEHHLRLFRRDALTFSPAVHGGAIPAPWARTHTIDPATGACIHHLSHRDVQQWIEKTNRYTDNPNRVRHDDGNYDLAAYAIRRINVWRDATKSDDAGGYAAAVALLRALYDIVDRVKVWEAELGGTGADRFRTVCETLRPGYPARIAGGDDPIRASALPPVSPPPRPASPAAAEPVAEALRSSLQLLRRAFDSIEHRVHAPLADRIGVLEAQAEAARRQHQAALARVHDELQDARRRASRFHDAARRTAAAAAAMTAELDHELARIRTRNAEAEAALAGLNAQLAAHMAHDARMQAANAAQQAELIRLREQIAAIEHSTVWRVTWPLRAGAAKLPLPLRTTGRLVLTKTWACLRLVRGSRLKAPAAAPPVIALLPDAAQAEPNPPPAPAQGPRDRFALDQLPLGRDDFSTVIEWYDDVAPEVSIIVLNWNRGAMTRHCLRHLWQRTTGRRYEIIVVDNGSDPADLAILQECSAFARIIPLGTNRYYGEANNIGVEAARGTYICLLNNDAFVHDNWLMPLLTVLDGEPRAAAVGPRFLFPSGMLQEAGALVSPDGTVIQRGKGRPGDDPEYRTRRPVDYISAACVVMRRQDFIDVLGFDLNWDPAYYEDVDLCLKLRLKGLLTFYCPHATVTHLEGATSSNPGKSLRLDTIVAINKVKFAERWGDYLRSGDTRRLDLLPAPSARGAGVRRGRILLFTPYQLTPGGGERYLLTMADALSVFGSVVLATPHRWSRIRIRTMAREFGLDLSHLDVMTVDDLADTAPFDLAFIIGNEIVPPRARMATTSVYICQFPFPAEDTGYIGRHRASLLDMALIMVYSDFVRGHVQRLLAVHDLPPRPVEIVPPPVPLQRRSQAKRRRILHVGRFFVGGHCKRQDKMVEAFRLLHDSGVDAELHFAGSINPEGMHRVYYAGVVASAAGLPVYFHPNCPPDELAELYATSVIYWHATGLGSDIAAEPHKAEHFGISLLEAMSAGCVPVVYGAGGPAELVSPGVNGWHFQTIEELCGHTSTLLQMLDDGTIGALADAAAAKAAEYGEDIFKARIVALAERFLPGG